MFKNFVNKLSNNIGIDLGTANTLVYLRDHGIVINEPSVVAINNKTDQIVAVGQAAKEMMGRTPGHIRSVCPVVDGVISDYEVTEEMLAYLITKTEKISKKFFKPRVVVGVPSGVTNVEARAVSDAAKSAGAREAYLIEEPLAAAIGIGMPVREARGSMIMDIGGGTTDIAVIALGGIVRSKNLKIAGVRFNQDIITYIKDEFKLLVGERTAESVKIAIGNAVAGEPEEVLVRGRDIISGLPREVVITDQDVREALAHSVSILVDGAREVLETTPPEILSDIMHRGMYLTGGGALLRGLDVLLGQTLKIPVFIAEDPLTAVVRGTGFVLDDIEAYEEMLLPIDVIQAPR